jgi:hypothetical protein
MDHSHEALPIASDATQSHKQGAQDDLTRREKSSHVSNSQDKTKQRKNDIDAGNTTTIEVINDIIMDGEYDVRKENHFGEATVIDNAKDLVTHVLHVDDDPSQSPWTFRAMFIGKSSAAS